MLFTALPLTILLSGTIAQATSLWKARNNYPSPDDKCTFPITIETTTPLQLPDVVLSSTETVPPILQNTTLPIPESGSTTIYTPNGGEIVVPVNTTSGSSDNGDVSQVILTPDNSSVTVGMTRNTSTEFFRPGTYVNAPDVQQGNTTIAFSFTGTTDYLGALSDPERQPSFPDKGGCTYEYKSVLGGGNGSVPAEGGLWALEGYVWLTPANVRQGSIGDCGMGSAILSLASQGIGAESWTKYLVETIDYNIIDVGADGNLIRKLAFNFKYPGKEATVLIDDTLPILATGACDRYIGFHPTLDAVEPGPNGDYPPTDVFFVPLLEKAFAKYIDAYPELRSQSTTDQGWTGYLGLTGIRPDIALASFTGGQPNSLFRDLESTAPIILALLRCIRDDVICAVDTYPTSLDGMGSQDEFGVVHLLGDSGWAASNSQWNQEVSFTVIDFDNLNSEGRSHLVEMIGLHAYGIDYLSTPYPGIVKLLNPWSCNPEYSDKSGYCSTYNGPQLELSLRVFVSMLRAVYWVENPLPLASL